MSCLQKSSPMRSTNYASDPVDHRIIAPLTCGKALSVTLDNMQRHIDQAKHHLTMSESQTGGD
jgi:hypothetical protein